MVKFKDFPRPLSVFECFSSIFQGKFYFQGLFKTVLYIQVLFKPVQTLSSVSALFVKISIYNHAPTKEKIKFVEFLKWNIPFEELDL